MIIKWGWCAGVSPSDLAEDAPLAAVRRAITSADSSRQSPPSTSLPLSAVFAGRAVASQRARNCAAASHSHRPLHLEHVAPWSPASAARPLARLPIIGTASPRMRPHESDRLHLERQIAYARPIIILLALIALFEHAPAHHAQRPLSFLMAYFVLSILAVPFERMLSVLSWHLPLACDLLALGFFLYVSPSTVPTWFPYLFVCYAARMR